MKYFFCLFLILLSPFIRPLQANPLELEQAVVEVISEVNRIQPGDPFWVVLKIKMKPGWHTYWIGDSGFATTVDWVLPSGFTAGSPHWLPPSRLESGKRLHFGYKNQALHLIQIIPDQEISSQEKKLVAKVDFLTCGKVCIPQSLELNLILPVHSQGKKEDHSKHYLFIHQLKQELPQHLTGEFEVLDNVVQFSFSLPEQDIKEIGTVTLLPLKKGVISNYEDQKFIVKKKMITITLPQEKILNLPNYEMLVQINPKTKDKLDNYQVTFSPKNLSVPPLKKDSMTLFSVLVFGFLGGLILNTMPCVFPILSIKALTIAKKKRSEFQRIRLQGLTYTVGVIVSFLSLAFLLITLKQGGHSLGWGFQMQSPYFIIFMIYLTFLIGLSLSGVFYLPIFFGKTASGLEENKLKGSFWLGVLAVLVATPCTAPFMGAAIGYALTQSIPTIILVFGTLSLGFSAPYLLICFFPVLLKLLPRPGAWMETFKELLAFPMYTTVLWLLWVLVQQRGSRALITVGSGLIIITFCLWLWRKLKLEGFFIKPLIGTIFVGLSLAPILYLKSPVLKSVVIEPFSGALLEKYRQEKSPIFVNATASWCITCKYNELTLQSRVVESLFKKNKIRYLEADWTNQSTEITELLESFGRSGVPLYIYYPVGKDPIILPQLLSEEILEKTVHRANNSPSP